MKYMTFNSACSFAGIANMLEQYGVDVTDREIALGMKLPYLFAYDEGAYVSGPMLQKEEWFNLYLNSIGFKLDQIPHIVRMIYEKEDLSMYEFEF